jgi:hypothetical protein
MFEHDLPSFTDKAKMYKLSGKNLEQTEIYRWHKGCASTLKYEHICC